MYIHANSGIKSYDPETSYKTSLADPQCNNLVMLLYSESRFSCQSVYIQHSGIIIDREAGEIIRLVVSVCLCIRPVLTITTPWSLSVSVIMKWDLINAYIISCHFEVIESDPLVFMCRWGEETLQRGSQEVRQHSGVFILGWMFCVPLLAMTRH